MIGTSITTPLPLYPAAERSLLLSELKVIERQFPSLLKLDLFALQAQAGWMSWGDQLPNGQLALPVAA